MSWFLKAVGSPAAVKAAILGNTSLSPALQSALAEICEDKVYAGNPYTDIIIEGQGHCGENSTITSLKVDRISILKDPQTLPPPPA